MFINLKKLQSLYVYTKSGEKLGKIYDFSLDVDNHTVIEYVVKKNYISSQELLIKPRQVLEITSKKIIVEDAILNKFSTKGIPVMSN